MMRMSTCICTAERWTGNAVFMYVCMLFYLCYNADVISYLWRIKKEERKM